MTLIRDGFQSADLDAPVVLPTLNLDFANSQSLDERITFSRGSIGTFVNKNGLIETAPANIPRFDYDQITGECKGLLIEESRSNLINNSTNIITGGGAVGLSTTTDGTLAPDGSNAILYIPTTGTTYHGNSSAITTTINLDTSGIATGSTYTFSYSMWLKDYNQSDLGVLFVSSGYLAGTPATNVTYDLRIAKPKTGTWVGGGLGPEWTILTQKAVLYPNGWYRFVRSIRYTRPANQNRIDFGWQVFNNRNAQFYNGDGVSGIYIWGPQIETGEFETSYIPTSGSTVTRSADVPTMTGTNFSSWYNQTESTIFCKFNAYQLMTTKQPIILSITGPEPSGLNRIQLLLNGAGGGGTTQPIYHNFYQNGPNFVDYFGFPYTTGPTKNIMRYKDLDMMVVSKDGNLRRASNTPRTFAVPLTKTMNTLTFGTFNGAISRFAYYPKALNDAEIQYLTQ